MSDTSSTDRPIHQSAGGSSHATEVHGPDRDPPVPAVPPADEQPTVISKRGTPPPDASRAPSRPGDLPPGARLEHFELLEYVGGGGMGRVYRATDTRLGRTVALKVLSRDQAADPEIVMRFRNEARSAARLNHEGIAQVYYVGEGDGLPFIAFEFIEGVNLRDLVSSRERMPLAEALNYTFQIAGALDHAARRNVVHRDIKPSNVIITAEGHAKLIDLGLARMQKLSESAADLTASGVTLGTFDYISPEQARDPRNADQRSDIYSLGCTLFFMLTGRPPFPEGTVLQKLLQHQGIEPPDVLELRPELPEEISPFLAKMMAKEPRRRFQQPAELIEALQGLAEQIGLRPVVPGEVAWTVPEESPGRRLRRHLPWMVPVALLMITVALLQVLFWSPLSDDAAGQPAWVGLREAPGESAPSPTLRGSSDAPETHDATGRLSASESAGVAAPKVPSGLSPPTTSVTGGISVAKLPPTEDASAATPAASGLNVLRSLLAGGPRNGGLSYESFAGGVIPFVEPSPTPAVEPATAPARSEVTRPSGPNGDPAPAKPSVEGVVPAKGALVVDPSGRTLDAFATLASACRTARDGDVIELRYDGWLEESPITLGNFRLTIAAGTGFRPGVRFRPSESDPVRYPRNMFALIGSRLNLADVALELDVPRDVPSDSWSLFAMGQGDVVRMERCWLTIRNAAERRGAYHQQVTFFRLEPAPGTDLLTALERPEPTPPAEIQLTDCVARGEADFIRDRGLLPVQVSWRNGLLATTERFLVAEGGEKAPHPDDALRIGLWDLTAVMDAGLCRLEQGEFSPYQLPLRVECSTSLLALSSSASLIEQVGVTDMEQSRDRVDWMGDRNLYQGFREFWAVRHLDPRISSESFDFENWQARWGSLKERLPRAGAADSSRLPEADRAVHLATPATIAAPAPAEGAVEPADTTRVGSHAHRLPPPPSDPPPLPSSPRLAAPPSEER